MLIGLHDAERDYMPKKTFPNLALMKLSAYHKAQGNIVEWWNPLMQYDRVYSSKVFDFTPENQYLPADTIRGGTGYRNIPVNQELPPETDGMFPDYSIYPSCDYAIGYITRGCLRHCPWCVVPAKEGKIRPYRTWQQVVRSDTDKLLLMDNNILACEHGITQLQQLINSGYRLDLNQGMDVRLVTPEIAKVLAKLKWIRFIRFSCDQASQLDHIFRVAELLRQQGIKPYRLFIYVLVTSDIADAVYRVEQLQRLNGINLYAQAERNEQLGIRPNSIQLEFAQRYVYGKCYKNESWNVYCKRHSLEVDM